EPVRVRDRQLGEFLAVHLERHGEGREVLAAVRLDLEGDVARLNGADRAEADPRRAPLPGYGAQFARVRVGVEGGGPKQIRVQTGGRAQVVFIGGVGAGQGDGDELHLRDRHLESGN